MSLTRDVAQQQAARLQACPMLCPQSAEGRREIVDTLLRHCQDAEHCRRTMTGLLDHALHIEGALTAEIAKYARETRDHGQAPPGCLRCDGGVTLDGVQQWHSHVERVLSSGGLAGVKRCNCERGRWLAAKDLERGQKSPEPKRKPAKHLEPVDGRNLAAGGGRE